MPHTPQEHPEITAHKEEIAVEAEHIGRMIAHATVTPEEIQEMVAHSAQETGLAPEEIQAALDAYRSNTH